LAELARLIGQEDPFAEFGQPQRSAHDNRQGRVPPPEWPNRPPRSAQPAAPHYDAARQSHSDPEHEAALHEATEAADQDYEAPQGEAEYGAHGYYADDVPEEAYDEPPPRGRRLGVVAIVAVFVLAVVGTAGAYGYRALFGHSGSAIPPIIKADTAPAKVAPPAKSEAQANKLIYDRVGEQTSNEKIVSREEQPVDLKDKVPSAAMSGAGAPAVDAGNVSTAAPVFASVDQPKRVHTIAIRPDQPQGVASAGPVSAPVSAPQTTAAVPSAPPPVPSPPPPAPKPAPQRVASAPAAATASHERPAPSHQATTASHNGPLSLSPDAAPARRPEPTRTASAPAAAAPAPAAASHSGGYTVQVSAQRSEAEAQAAFRSLQGKYPSQLGGRQPIIKRADLGSKGVYYRALVGPFASSGEATQLCQSLKAAGGSCLIQRN
jgi:hypothetical protein